MKHMRNWQCWVLGALMTAALFAGLYRISNFRFENSDDIVMLKSFMGFEGGRPADFSLYIHTLLAFVFYGLGLAAPQIAWYSLYQLALLFLSCTVIVKCLYQLAQTTRWPFWVGSLASLVYIALFAVFACCRLNFTTTVSLAGAAAVLQVTTVDFSAPQRGKRFGALALALLLFVGGYCLRAFAMLPALLFIGLVLALRFVQHRQGQSPSGTGSRALLRTALVFTAVLLCLYGVRQAEISVRNLSGFMRWNDASAALFDYSTFESDPQPAIRSGSGLSATEVELVRQWYFMSSDITEQSLWDMAAAYRQPENGALSGLTLFLAGNPRYGYLAGILLLLCGLSLLGARKGEKVAPFVSLAATLVTFALLGYLAARGRLLARAADSVLMPCAALNLCLALPVFDMALVRGRLRRVAVTLLAVAVCLSAGMSLRITAKAITVAQDNVSLQREAELETFALQNPKVLLVRTPNLLRDTRLFPDVSQGIPTNIILWGDWLCHTPSWNRQLALFGFDAEQFTAADWLRDGILFAASAPEDTAALCAYLSQATGATVVPELYGTSGTLLFYRFKAL